MKYGCCVNLLPRQDDPAGLRYAPTLKKLGYDYIEIPLRVIVALPEGEFEALCEQLKELKLPCLCCNDFMPPEMHVVGEHAASREEIEAYFIPAAKRMKQLGALYTVFGSPWSRACPEGFPMERGLEQIRDFLKVVGAIAARYGVTVVIEHNNRTETNTMNHFSDVLEMARRVDSPNVRVMCDYYHLRYEGDPPQVLQCAGDWLLHTHIAQLEGRQYVTDPGKEPLLEEYGRVLRAMGYQGGVSVEGYLPEDGDWERVAQANLQVLKQALG